MEGLQALSSSQALLDPVSVLEFQEHFAAWAFHDRSELAGSACHSIAELALGIAAREQANCKHTGAVAVAVEFDRQQIDGLDHLSQLIQYSP